MPALKNWALVENRDPFQAPEMWEIRLYGQVFDHPGFEDGLEVTTSKPTAYDASTEEFITTSGSRYTLAAGDVNPDYEAAFPGARQRLITNVAPATP